MPNLLADLTIRLKDNNKLAIAGILIISDFISISFSANDPSSSSSSASEDKTTWKDFIALKAVNVTYVKDTVA
jgi:hypothetical protein